MASRSLRAISLHSLWRQIWESPLPEPEDSLPLRVLVQLLVTIGILATDIAAADVVDASGASVWAIPASWIGAMWSWQRRRYRNVPVKFCIAIAMLLALAVFFMRLVAERNDTRMALAGLLIQLQVFHSFDLPRRKDLGYSMVIGLILLGVAATLSQTFAFAPLLLLFLGVAIPVLILDYRSRLGLVTPHFKGIGADFAPRRLAGVLLGIVALGLAIFLLLPRVPGYQLRSFPVSAPIDFPGEFDGQAIQNPGYAQGGSEGTGSATGRSPETGAGEADEEFYYGFNSRMNQNLRGALQPKVVMRVRSQAAGFWRVLAFDRYTGQGWEISRNDEDEVKTLDRPSWSFRFLLPWSVNINRTREVVQSYTVVADLPNLIPVLYQPKELYFPTDQVAIDSEGGLRSPVPLSEGLTYTAISDVPYRDRTALRGAPAAPEFIQNTYLQLPQISDRVRQQTTKILAASPVPLTNPYEKALFLAQYLKQNYRIQVDLPFFDEEEDLVEAFLFKYQGGYPDHFSTVLTVMLRSIGIPARLSVGFGSGEFNPFTGFYVVKNTDAFAVTEVYFHKYDWFAFDPIPGHELLPTSIEDSQTFSALRQFWNWIASWLPSPLAGWLNGLFRWIGDAIGRGLAWITSLLTSGWLGVLTGVLLVTIVGFIGWLGWSGWQAWRYRRWLGKLPIVESIYQQMLRGLALQGLPKSPSQTPLEYAHACRDRTSPDRWVAIDAISQDYLRWRYGRKEPNIAALKQHLRSLRQRGRSKESIARGDRA